MDKDKHRRRHKKTIVISAALLVIIIVGWSVLVHYLSPEDIIERIGARNGYIAIFIGGLIGGISLFIPFPNYLLVLTFGAAGLHPILLGFLAAVGVIIGECTSYFFGHSVNTLLPKSMESRAKRLDKWLLKQPKKMVYLALFVWGAIFPFPNDFILVPLGVLKYPFWRVMIPLGLGNIVFNIILAYAGRYGWNLIFG